MYSNSQKLEQLIPQDNPESCNQFLSNFDWRESALGTEALKAIEELLVELHHIFARHRFDIDINNDFKIKLTPFYNSSAFSQSVPTPMKLKKDITVEVAVIRKYCNFTTLPISRHASPFYEIKPNCKPCLFVDFCYINNLI